MNSQETQTGPRPQLGHYIPIRDYPSLQEEQEEMEKLDHSFSARVRFLLYEKALLEKMDCRETFHKRLLNYNAIETGQIEGLYDLDMGTTQTLIELGFTNASLISHDAAKGQDPEQILAQLRDQHEALEGLYSFVKQESQLNLTYVRELHKKLCQHQDSVWAEDPSGKRAKIPLRKGAWKDMPNNPRLSTGKETFHYCPLGEVQPEMDYWLEQLRNFMQAPLDDEHWKAIIATAWLHHRFSLIHPFQDGNGRMARLLASLLLIRYGFYPFLVQREQHLDYLQALEAADNKNLAPLCNFLVKVQKDSIEMGDQLCDEQKIKQIGKRAKQARELNRKQLEQDQAHIAALPSLFPGQYSVAKEIWERFCKEAGTEASSEYSAGDMTWYLDTPDYQYNFIWEVINKSSPVQFKLVATTSKDSGNRGTFIDNEIAYTFEELDGPEGKRLIRKTMIELIQETYR